MKNLIKAVLSVMNEIDGVEKNLNVGSGTNTYKGVSDKDVRLKIRRLMVKHGLTIFTTNIKDEVHIDRWEEQGRTKQSILTSVVPTYLLVHESGEQMEIQGYGHGQDSQDKSAGKATTYALKYALLNTFLVPTGDIDDADREHSDDKPVPPKAQPQKELQKSTPTPNKLPELTPTHKSWAYCQKRIKEGIDIQEIKNAFTISDENLQLLLS